MSTPRTRKLIPMSCLLVRLCDASVWVGRKGGKVRAWNDAREGERGQEKVKVRERERERDGFLDFCG